MLHKNEGVWCNVCWYRPITIDRSSRFLSEVKRSRQILGCSHEEIWAVKNFDRGRKRSHSKYTCDHPSS